MERLLRIDLDKYEGKYVALKSFTDNTVLAFGKKPQKVLEAALETGIEEPVIVYIPRRDTNYIYSDSIDSC